MIDFENIESSLENIKLMRTVNANMQLAELCPGHDMKRFSEIVNGDDTTKSFNTMINVILICNKAAEEFEQYKNPQYEMQLVTRDELLFLTEEQLGNLCVRALDQIKKDGKTSIEIEPIKNPVEAEEVASSSTTAG